MPEDVTINISKGAPLPPVPDMGDGKKHKWGEVRHVHVFWWWRCLVSWWGNCMRLLL